ncbi:hypothetical protein B0H21DRAFT_115752 [Amylocystis lapponica]|nr:hypothetical protein B0H21DRAFT_115752 [Amylocystis lapponica]
MAQSPSIQAPLFYAPSSSPLVTRPIEQLRILFRQTLRITIHDRRVFLGTFVGTDKQLNILLVNTDEYRIGTDYEGNLNGRFVGQVMVPWRFIRRIEARAGNGSDSDDESMYM